MDRQIRFVFSVGCSDMALLVMIAFKISHLHIRLMLNEIQAVTQIPYQPEFFDL